MAIDYEALAAHVVNAWHEGADEVAVLRDAFTAELAEVRAERSDELSLALKTLMRVMQERDDRDRTIAERDAEIKRMTKAMTHIRNEAERENGNWTHLKRCIAVQASQALGDRHHD